MSCPTNYQKTIPHLVLLWLLLLDWLNRLAGLLHHTMTDKSKVMSSEGAKGHGGLNRSHMDRAACS